MASPLVNRTEALKKPAHHQYVQGIGHLTHSGPPELPPGANGSKNCDPPEGTKDGTHHMMKPPNGGAPVRMSWNAGQRVWMSINPGKGNRLGWSVEHLRKAGWSYARAVKG